MMDQVDVEDEVVRNVKATWTIVAESRSHRWKAQYGRQQSVSSVIFRTNSGMATGSSVWTSKATQLLRRLWCEKLSGSVGVKQPGSYQTNFKIETGRGSLVKHGAEECQKHIAVSWTFATSRNICTCSTVSARPCVWKGVLQRGRCLCNRTAELCRCRSRT